MEDKKIIVQIDENGKIKAETFGFNGVGCLEELTKLMKDVASLESGTKKNDFYKNKVDTINVARVKHD